MTTVFPVTVVVFPLAAVVASVLRFAFGALPHAASMVLAVVVVDSRVDPPNTLFLIVNPVCT